MPNPNPPCLSSQNPRDKFVFVPGEERKTVLDPAFLAHLGLQVRLFCLWYNIPDQSKYPFHTILNAVLAVDDPEMLACLMNEQMIKYQREGNSIK